MKKIVSAVALAAVAAGFATAEVKISANFRERANLLTHGGSRSTTLLDQDGVDSESDGVTLKGSAEYGGFEFELDPVNLTDGSTRGDETGLTLQKYNGWINFGDFMIKMGTWDARAVGRANGSSGNHEGRYFGEFYKPGLANKLLTNGLGVDISQQSEKYETGMVQYNNKGLGLEVRAAYQNYKAKSNNGTGTETADLTYFEDGDINFAVNRFMLEAGYTVKDVGRVLVTTKAANYDWAGSIFFEPKLADLKQLTAVVGAVYERNVHGGYTKNITDSSGDYVTAQAIGGEARVRYAVNDQLAVTAMFNFTGGDAAANAASDGFVGGYASWGMVNVSYKLNDTFTPFCSVGYSSGLSSEAKNNIDRSKALTKINKNVDGGSLKFNEKWTGSVRIYPGVEIYNTKNANIITGVCVDVLDLNEKAATYDDNENIVVTVPLLFRVKF